MSRTDPSPFERLFRLGVVGSELPDDLVPVVNHHGVSSDAGGFAVYREQPTGIRVLLGCDDAADAINVCSAGQPTSVKIVNLR